MCGWADPIQIKNITLQFHATKNIRLGTLNSILQDVADQLGLTKEDILKK